ncbi:hypothetical protein QTH91_11525 [Variovorax dokdonensis]|uniref:Uncharacterized protein n=1 Tax=Variovorax dokdonensis TaxID=344883 RepID=A0ABT7NB06_9BURK|nr:hypothetical protein [Variovorax dokdonensis]MDM0045114.1 hypothetical protein [Variovorax dokdonensis]
MFATLWALGRLPLALFLLFLARRPLLDLTEQYLGIERITHFAISLMSTPLVRAILWVGLVLALGAVCAWSGRKLNPWRAYFVRMAAGALLILALFHHSGTALWKAVLPLLCLAGNLLPVTPAQRVDRRWSAFMAIGVGVAETFFFRRYVDWFRGLRDHNLREVRPGTQAARWPDLVGIAFAAGLAVALLSASGLLGLERAIRMPSKVEILLQENINGLALDPSGRHLYVTGHGLAQLRRIDVLDPKHPFIESDASTGGAQGVNFDPAAGELYLFNVKTRSLQVFDAGTLALRREMPLPDLAPGDPWVATDPVTDTLMVASEADERTGSALLVVDRRTGKVLDRRDEDAGNVLMHPQGGRVYLSFFRNINRLMLYDFRKRDFVAEVVTDARVDRMAFDASRSEVLLASPLRSAVLRFDADTLKPRGQIPGMFGVRVMAIDDARGWMVSGSLTTGQIEVRSLKTGEHLRSIYLGPWLRSIVLDPQRALAYVSANGALYKVAYD